LNDVNVQKLHSDIAGELSQTLLKMLGFEPLAKRLAKRLSSVVESGALKVPGTSPEILYRMAVGPEHDAAPWSGLSVPEQQALAVRVAIYKALEAFVPPAVEVRTPQTPVPYLYENAYELHPGAGDQVSYAPKPPAPSPAPLEPPKGNDTPVGG
jgi:hypothetical protein